jgi:hypothetical protein
MDEQRTRDHIDQHADAVVRGDMDAIVADFSEELRPEVPQIAQSLPQPVTRADVLSVEIGDTEKRGDDSLFRRQGRRDDPLAMAGPSRSPRDRARRTSRINAEQHERGVR